MRNSGDRGFPLSAPAAAPCRQGAKLDYNHISALIYGLGVGLGFQTFPLAPPDQEVLLGAKH